MKDNLLDRLPVRFKAEDAALSALVQSSVQEASDYTTSYQAIMHSVGVSCSATKEPCEDFRFSAIVLFYHAFPHKPKLELPGCDVENNGGFAAAGAKFPMLLEVWENPVDKSPRRDTWDVRAEYISGLDFKERRKSHYRWIRKSNGASSCVGKCIY